MWALHIKARIRKKFGKSTAYSDPELESRNVSANPDKKRQTILRSKRQRCKALIY